TGVARRHIGENAGFYNGFALVPQLLDPPPSALLEACGHEQFNVRIRTDNGADIAPIEYRPGPAGRRMTGEMSVKFQQSPPPRRGGVPAPAEGPAPPPPARGRGGGGGAGLGAGPPPAAATGSAGSLPACRTARPVAR